MRLLMASLLTCLLVEGVTSGGSDEQQEKQPALMRKKRYLVFPQGSNVQLVYCLTIGAYGRAGDLVLGLTAALAWELPSKVEPKFAGLLHRHSRAAIYFKIEAFLQSLGIDGRSCVMRALCEAAQRSTFSIGTGSFLQELLHAIFTITSASDVSELNKGSNVQLIYCLTVGALTKPEGFFTIGVTAGLAYELPHKSSLSHRKPAEVYHRRSRRDLYRKLELMFQAQGKDGRGCVLKAICQAGKRHRDFSVEVKLKPFLDEILHSIFSFPSLSSGPTVEPLELLYEEAYNAQDDCDKLFLSCPDIF